MEPVPGYAAANWEKGYGDFVMKPDLATLRRLPWLPGSALVLCDILDHHHHEDVPHAPRGMLKKQIARLAAMKMSAFFASELEFYLFDETYESVAAKGYRDLKTAGAYIEDYHIFQTTKEEGVMRAIRTGLEGAGIPVENSKGEWGPGQEEINVRYADALTMADRHVILKNGVQGDRPGSGQGDHLHGEVALRPRRLVEPHPQLAVGRGRQEAALPRSDKGEHGMSKLMRHYVAGQLAYAREITWFLAPYINSYKRFQVGTFAPTKAIWSLDNRTAGFRLCGADTEGDPHRMPDRRRRPQPLSRLRRAARRRPRRHRTGAGARGALCRRRLLRQAPPRGAEDAPRGDRDDGASRRCSAPPSATR